MESLHQDSSLSQQDRHTKMMDIHQSTDTQIRALLDSNQQKKWDEMQPSVSNGDTRSIAMARRWRPASPPPQQ
jgi:hypothetical protein